MVNSNPAHHMGSKLETILEEAARVVDGDREELYGHPSQNFYDTAKLWSAILHYDVTPQQVALCMIALKLARQTNKPKRDNLVDIAGYARTIEKLEDPPTLLRGGAGMGRGGNAGDNAHRR